MKKYRKLADEEMYSAEEKGIVRYPFLPAIFVKAVPPAVTAEDEGLGAWAFVDMDYYRDVVEIDDGTIHRVAITVERR